MAVFKGTERYVVLRYLGSGSFGEVYEVFDRERQTKVALKIPHETTAGGLYYFKREFRSLVDVIHPNLATLYELVGDKDQWFFTMELIQGTHFKDYLHGEVSSASRSNSSGASATGLARSGSVQGRWDFPDSYCTASVGCAELDYQPMAASGGTEGQERVLHSPPSDYDAVRVLLRQLAEGLNALHQAGKLHRDIKPSNVLVSRSGHLSILDFGLVVDTARGGVEDAIATHLIGTPAYMAPEQLEGHRGTEASDWYSVGVMLYEVLTGHQPFQGTLKDIMRKKVRQDPLPPSSLVPDTPEDLEGLCMQLLDRNPAARPKGAAVLEQVKGFSALQVPKLPGAPLAMPLLVGRDRELGGLFDAFRGLFSGTAALVQIHGGSGTGKTMLLRQFVGEIQQKEPRAVVLQGRCYEQESVPFKAIDPLIDDLSRHLSHLPDAEAESLVPRNAPALARLFPVLDRIEAFHHGSPQTLDYDDAKVVRRRAVLALRELLGRLCAQRPVIMIIDDLQWGDLDSANLLRDIFAPPEPPPLMLVVCYRSEEATSAPVLLELLGRPMGVRSVEIPLRELSPRLAEDLAMTLIGPNTPEVERLAKRIARDSGGNPFFIGELAHHSQSGYTESEDVLENTLYGCIQQRVASLPEDIQRIVETLALAGHPLTWEVIKRTSALEGAKLPPASLLKAARLVRTRSTRDRQALEIYHDFVRRAILSTMSGSSRRSGHLRLAEVLETCGEAEPETLAKHYILAGESRKAADYLSRAGDKAAASLAFKGAADLYRKSLEMRPLDDPAIPELFLRLGNVLSTAGLGKEAAETYRFLASLLEPSDCIRIQRRAAEEYFRSGHFAMGMSTLEPVLASIGIKLVQNPILASISAAYFSLRLYLRGLGVRERQEKDVPAEDLERIDIVWTAVQGMGTGAIMQGMDLQARHLLLALRVGEPSRVVRAMAHQVIHESIRGNRAAKDVQKYQSRSLALAERLGDPKLLAYAYLTSGLAALRLGRWTESIERFETAKKVYQEQCVGVSYELHQVHLHQMHAQFILGQFKDIHLTLPGLIRDAEERGDILAEANLKTSYSMFYYLAKDEPEIAQRHVRKALGIWSSTEFHYQHWQALILQGTIDQYTGHPEVAWKNLLVQWQALRESRLLSVQLIRIACMEHRARTAIAFAKYCPKDSPERSAAMKVVHASMSAIRREKTNYGNTTYFKLKGMEAAMEGRVAESIDWLFKAEVAYHACSMPLHANVMRWCRGVQSGAPGGNLVSSAESWMVAHGIVKPERYVRVHSPGFERPSTGNATSVDDR